MVMMGIHFNGDIPFKHIYIHPLGKRMEDGQKMSKSKGNKDPVKLVDKYGVDVEITICINVFFIQILNFLIK